MLINRGLAAITTALALATVFAKVDDKCSRHKFGGARLPAPVQKDGSVKWELVENTNEWYITCNNVTLNYDVSYGHADMQLIGPGDENFIPAHCPDWTQAVIDESFPADFHYVLGDLGFLSFQQDNFEVAIPAYTDRDYALSLYACNGHAVWRPQDPHAGAKWSQCSTSPYVE